MGGIDWRTLLPFVRSPNEEIYGWNKNAPAIFGQELCDLLVLDEASQRNLPEALMAALALFNPERFTATAPLGEDEAVAIRFPPPATGAGVLGREGRPLLGHDGPGSYLVCADDQTATPAWARRAARARLGVEPVEMPGGQCPMLSRPRQLAEVLDQGVREPGGAAGEPTTSGSPREIKCGGPVEPRAVEPCQTLSWNSKKSCAPWPIPCPPLASATGWPSTTSRARRSPSTWRPVPSARGTPYPTHEDTKGLASRPA
jgi:hypothetical protein